MQRYGVQESAKLLGLPRSTIRAFVEAGFVHPERGPRRSLQFSFRDLIVLRTAQSLVAAKVPQRRITRSLKRLREQLPESMPLSGLSISAVGEQVVVREGHKRWQADSGQYLLAFEGDPAQGSLSVVETRSEQSPEMIDGHPAADAAGPASQAKVRGKDAQPVMLRQRRAATGPGRIRARTPEAGSTARSRSRTRTRRRRAPRTSGRSRSIPGTSPPAPISACCCTSAAGSRTPSGPIAPPCSRAATTRCCTSTSPCCSKTSSAARKRCGATRPRSKPTRAWRTRITTWRCSASRSASRGTRSGTWRVTGACSAARADAPYTPATVPFLALSSGRLARRSIIASRRRAAAPRRVVR